MHSYSARVLHGKFVEYHILDFLKNSQNLTSPRCSLKPKSQRALGATSITCSIEPRICAAVIQLSSFLLSSCILCVRMCCIMPAKTDGVQLQKSVHDLEEEVAINRLSMFWGWLDVDVRQTSPSNLWATPRISSSRYTAGTGVTLRDVVEESITWPECNNWELTWT